MFFQFHPPPASPEQLLNDRSFKILSELPSFHDRILSPPCGRLRPFLDTQLVFVQSDGFTPVIHVKPKGVGVKFKSLLKKGEPVER